MTILSKKYTVTDCLAQAADIDEMLDDIYGQLTVSLLNLPMAKGSLFYASAANVIAAFPDVAVGSALISGGVGLAPSWGKIDLTLHVTGTLPVTNGGTGTPTTFTLGSVVFAGASGVYTQDNAKFFWDNTNKRLAIGHASANAALDILAPGTDVGVVAQFKESGTTGNAYVDIMSAGSGSGNESASIRFWQSVHVKSWLMGVIGNGPGTDAFQIVSPTSTDYYAITTRMNLLLGNIAQPSTGTYGIFFKDGTLPATLDSNTAGLYANDVGGTVRMFAIDEDGITGEIAKLSGPLTSGRIVFKGSAGLLTDDADLTWDTATNSLAVTNRVTANTFVIDPASSGYLWFSGRALIKSPADSQITLFDSAEATFDRINFGGTSSTDPALRREGSLLASKQADAADYTYFKAYEYFLTSGGYLMRSNAAMTNGAGALVGTLTNSPVTGNPTKWLKFDDNGTLRYIPAW